MIYKICLDVLKTMSSEEIRSLSWFGKNKKQASGPGRRGAQPIIEI